MPDPRIKPCGHAAPVFGCDGCIQSDREAWAERAYAEWKKTYRLPKCPGCGAAMIHYGKNTYPSKLEAIVICPGIDGDGCATCEEHDITAVIA